MYAAKPSPADSVRIVPILRTFLRTSILAAVGFSTLAALAPAAEAAAGKCPKDAEIAMRLELPGHGWKLACKPDETAGLLLAAVRPHNEESKPAELVVGTSQGPHESHHAAVSFEAPAEKHAREVATTGDEWKIQLGRARIGSESFIRVGLKTTYGGNLIATYELVSFLRDGHDGLTPLWTGIGDWEENRFDICLLKARATFKVSGDKLARTTHIAKKRGTAPVDEAPAKEVEKECVVDPVKEETFPLPPHAS